MNSDNPNIVQPQSQQPKKTRKIPANKRPVQAERFNKQIASWRLSGQPINPEEGITQNVNKFAQDQQFRKTFTDYSKTHAVKGRTIDHIIATKLVDDALRMSQKDGYVVPQSERQALRIMLAADDFKISEFVQGVGSQALKLGQKYLLPALKTAFPVYGDIADQLVSQIIQTDNDTQSIRVRKTIVFLNFQIDSDSLNNLNLNPGYDTFGWISQIARAYQYYHVHSMTVDFKTSAALNNSGMLKYYVNYDMDLYAQTLSDLDSQAQLQLSPVFSSHSHTWTAKDLHQRYPKFRIRSTRVPTETSEVAQQYDFGRLIAGHNSNTFSIGLIELTLDIEFFQPIIDPLIYANSVHASGLQGSGSVSPQYWQTIFDTTSKTLTSGGEVSKIFRSPKTAYFTFLISASGTNSVGIQAPKLYVSYNATDFTQITFGTQKYFNTSGNQYGYYTTTVKLTQGQYFAFVRNGNEWFNGTITYNAFEGWIDYAQVQVVQQFSNERLVSPTINTSQGLVDLEQLFKQFLVKDRKLQQQHDQQIESQPMQQRDVSLQRLIEMKQRLNSIDKGDDDNSDYSKQDFQRLTRNKQ